MKKIKLGKLTFKAINEHSIYRFESNRFTWVASAFGTSLFVIFAVFNSGFIYSYIGDSDILMLLYCLLLLAFALYISLATRLFKRRVIIDRNSQTICSSYMFSIQIQKVAYEKLFVSSIYMHGEIGPSGKLMYLSEIKIDEKTLKKSLVRHLRFNENDKRFVHALKHYMRNTSFK